MLVQSSTSKKGVQGMSLILVLYVDGLFLIGNEHMMIKVRGRWPLKLEMKNRGMMDNFMEIGK